jgi:hypothetical protein
MQKLFYILQKTALINVIHFWKIYYYTWWESQKERDHWEDKDVGGWTILKWILER